MPHKAESARRLAGNVLLVEDNIINQQVARELLENLGLLVHTAGNGREALDALYTHAFDLVLMDIQMPEMDGYEATRRLRAEPAFEKLPVVAMTAHAMSGDREKCLAAGMNEHIPKPIDPEGLLKTLSQWLEPGGQPAPGEEDSFDTGPDVALPKSLPGLDLRWGLERVGGNRRLFHKLRGDFVANHGQALQLLEERLGGGDPNDARREIHTLQGVAGNIGARDLQQAARRLETALVEGRITAADGLPREFRDAFEVLIGGLTRLEEDERTQEAVTEPGENVASDVDIAILLDRLDQLLEEGDPGAGKLLRQVETTLPDPDLLNTLQLLAEQIERYDFDQARETLVALCENLMDHHNA